VLAGSLAVLSVGLLAFATPGFAKTEAVLVNLPRSEPKALIEPVDPEGRVLTAQSVTFESPGQQARPRRSRKDHP
jgi:hypothetical protein